MSVSWRNMLIAAGGTALVSLSGIAMAQTCCDGGKDHTVTVPGITIPSPSIVTGTATTQVGSQYIYGYSSSSTLTTGVTIGGADTRTTFISNGSYIPMADPIPPATLDLNVKGSERVKEIVTEKVPIEEKVCVDKIVEKVMVAPVEAVCLDDTGMPHPASRLDAEVGVKSDYSGEVFRCVSGTFMQVTIGTLNGDKADFSSAQSFRCSKGEALVHAPGGLLKCAAQAPQRNCNERSLLRKYGSGLKLIETRVRQKICEPTIQTRYEVVKKEVEKDVPFASKPITLDGGVGQIITY